MLGSEIKSFTDSLVQDTSPESWFYNALNVAKDSIEEQRDWEFLRVLDTSSTRASGATVSASYTLPTYFRQPLTLTVGSDTTPRQLISMGDARVLRDEPGYWYINHSASTYHLTGTEGAGGTIYLYYTKSTPDLDASGTPVWPSRFHRLLGYDVARQWFLQDQGEKEFSWAAEMDAEARRLLNAMILWDESLKSQAQNHRPADMTFAAQIS
jgi:hypothetical protein